MSLATREADLLEEFADFEDWQEKYRHVIDLGKELPAFPEELKRKEFIVKGCVSTVWLQAQKDGANVIYRGDSDSVFVKGLVALLIEIYSGATPAEIVACEDKFVTQSGITQNLSPNRANGFASMLKQIKAYASALE